jgi:hypothetical protein
MCEARLPLYFNEISHFKYFLKLKSVWLELKRKGWPLTWSKQFAFSMGDSPEIFHRNLKDFLHKCTILGKMSNDMVKIKNFTI